MMNFKRNAVFVNVLWAWGMIALLFMASCKIGQKDENKEKNMEAWTMADGFSVDGREIVDEIGQRAATSLDMRRTEKGLTILRLRIPHGFYIRKWFLSKKNLFFWIPFLPARR